MAADYKMATPHNLGLVLLKVYKIITSQRAVLITCPPIMDSPEKSTSAFASCFEQHLSGLFFNPEKNIGAQFTILPEW